MASSYIDVQPSKQLRTALWIAQVVIFGLFTMFGCMKLFLPVERLAAWWSWPGQVPVWFLHFTGILDAAGGIGVLIPALTRIKPRLTVLAALGCTLLQIAAIIFHLVRGEAPVLPLNIVLLALSIFILWGRGAKAPISSRR
jgi:uncharacterized membrane protein YphA (DoxX/SURF4 family)